MNTAREVNRSAQRQRQPSLHGGRKPLADQVLGGYWRIPVFALVGALLAFSVSFVFKSQYSAVARLIIHPNDSSYAGTDSGAEVAGTVNIGGIDITKQTTLGNTLVNLATSNEAATEIVKRIGIEKINGSKEAPKLGTTSKLINFLKVGGTGTAPTAEQAAIDRVRGALNVVVLDESWVMEITAWDPDPKLAGLIATTAADVAVQQGEARFKENSQRELDYLNGQLEGSRANVAAKAQAVEQFEATLVTPAQVAAGQGQLAALKADLASAQSANSTLEDRQAAVAAMVSKPRFDTTRLGDVVTSTAPARPMRYLFLLVGALVGALAGLLLTWFRSIREEESYDESETPDRGSRSGGSNGERPARTIAARPDVRFDEVIDVRTPVATVPGSGDVTLPPPFVQQNRTASKPEKPVNPPVPVDLSPASGVGRQSADAGTLSPGEAGSIAAALFDRTGAARFSG